MATVNISGADALDAVVVPLDFDEVLEVRNAVDNTKLVSKSQNGFLAVEIGNSTEYKRTLEVVINPDLQMWVNALSPWAVLLMLAALCLSRALARIRQI